MAVIPNIRYPILQQNGQEFACLEDILAHLDGENTGLYLIGLNCMWHGGIHITDVTTPWCALSGNAPLEIADFPTSYPYKGEQFIRCMADGDVVAYRVCRDYMEAPWEGNTLYFSGSFLLVRHYIQPGEKKESGLQFYTLYMHLAPYSAYEDAVDKNQWIVQNNLSAYKPEWLLAAFSDDPTASADYRAGMMPEGAIVEWDPSDKSQRVIAAYNKREYGLVTFKGLTSEAKSKLKSEQSHAPFSEGEQCWIVVDKDPATGRDNLAPYQSARPSWWGHFTPPTESMKFNSVECPAPFPIKAGDSVGHLGYYQSAKDFSHEARYQVHIECLSIDKNLPVFLKNPEHVGKDNPVYLKYEPGMPLYCQDIKTEQFVKDTRLTKSGGVLPLSQVPLEPKGATPQYYKISLENGYLLKEDKTPARLSQYDLEALGFTLLEDDPQSFDHLDGETPPEGLVRFILEFLLSIAIIDPIFAHALTPYNIQRLLNMIGTVKQYSPVEYRQMVHIKYYLHHLYKIIVKHPSEWYFKPDHVIWKIFLDKLLPDAPFWKSWSEVVIGQLSWMQDAEKKGLTLGPSLWHMHPVMFLDAIRKNKEKQIIFPLMVKPENEPGYLYSEYDWRNLHGKTMPSFGASRKGKRQHAARDLYTKEYAKVVSICDGVVLESRLFYKKTNQVTIKHKTNDGREFIVRYGELDPKSVKVKVNDIVRQGQSIGNTGKLLNEDNTPVLVLKGKTVFMLHFEYYTGDCGLNIKRPLTDQSRMPFQRRKDLADPLPVLVEGYNNTFVENDNGRVDVRTLSLSSDGKEFIKGWESLCLKTYNDSEGYCTIGYGHLIERNKCENINIPTDFKNGISEQKADELFNNDVPRFENGVRQAVFVKLYQHEFDALVSLLFNCGDSFFRKGKAPNLIRKLNEEDYAGAANEFLDITNGGQRGAVVRRNAEHNMFLNGVYNSTH
ncbi:peptidoglycan DD-metalloendopeptidase family protein [Salmonella enterica subsp. enterica]